MNICRFCKLVTDKREIQHIYLSKNSIHWFLNKTSLFNFLRHLVFFNMISFFSLARWWNLIFKKALATDLINSKIWLSVAAVSSIWSWSSQNIVSIGMSLRTAITMLSETPFSKINKFHGYCQQKTQRFHNNI